MSLMPDHTICPGVTEVRQITPTLFGVRVSHSLTPKLKNLPEFHRANSRSDLFCFEVSPMDKSTEGALKRFKEIVIKAGLGPHFGIGTFSDF